MQARAGSAGVAISAVETTAPDEIPRRGAPVPRELEIDGGAEAVTQHALSQRAIGMCGETGVIDPDKTITTGKVLSEGAGMIEMALHASRGGLESVRNRRKVVSVDTVRSEGNIAARGQGDHLAGQTARRDAVERLALHVDAEIKRMTPEKRGHGDVRPQTRARRVGFTSRRARIRDAQAHATDHIDKPFLRPQDTVTREHVVDVVGVDENRRCGIDSPGVPGLEFSLRRHASTTYLASAKRAE